MESLKAHFKRIWAIDPIPMEAGLASTTFWMIIVWSMPVDTALKYGIYGVNDNIFAIALAIVCAVQTIALLISASNLLRTIAATMGALVYFFMAYASFVVYPGSFGNALLIPALESLYIVFRLGDRSKAGGR